MLETRRGELSWRPRRPRSVRRLWVPRAKARKPNRRCLVFPDPREPS